jgi:transcriptional regulator with XRE-family HTH domain
MSILSENLKKARKAIDGLSQDKAAKFLAVKRSTLGAWEEGRSTPPLAKFPKITQLYNITDWSGFILSEKFDPQKQPVNSMASISFMEEQYKKLPKKLKKVADELLKCG